LIEHLENEKEAETRNDIFESITPEYKPEYTGTGS